MLKKAWSDYWSSWSWKTFIKRNKGGTFMIWYVTLYPWMMLTINRDTTRNFTDEIIRCFCIMLYMAIILIAVISQRCALLCLPKQMFLCPMTKNEREEYLKRLLQIKIIVPFAFAFAMKVILMIILQFRLEVFLAMLFSFLVLLLALNITVWPGSMWRVKDWGKPYNAKNKTLKGLVAVGVVGLTFSTLPQAIVIFAMDPEDQTVVGFRVFLLIMVFIQAIAAIGILSYTKRVIAIGCDYEYSLQGIDELNKARGESI